MREERERMRRILHGLIPWDVESFIEAHTFAARLRKTPKDDWDHKEHSITMDLARRRTGRLRPSRAGPLPCVLVAPWACR